MFRRSIQRVFIFITLLISSLTVSAQEFNTDSVKVIFADGATLSFQSKSGEKLEYSDIIEVLIGIETLADSADRYNGFYQLDKSWGKLTVDTRVGRDFSSEPKVVTNSSKESDFWNKWDNDWDSDWEESETINVKGDDGISINFGHSNNDGQKKTKRRTRSYWNMDLGLNTYVENGEIPGNVPYRLDPLGSRYVAFSHNWRTQIGNLDKSPFFIKYGLSISWNNYMFEDDVLLSVEGEEVVFGEVPSDWSSVKKNKLAVANIGIPIMLQIGRDKGSFQFGIGGYANYRIDSWQKHKFTRDGDTEKEKDHDPFNIQDFRYGLSTEIGIPKAGFKIFANYELSPLFRYTDTNPELNTIMFGIRF
ncbi:outer membrane beta-barrel protein [Sediminitomix flava]|uniref:Outer membrane protein with beta-barrel domain n=1 Tax=Sediminitomix flava TaxID=379075 RepID=A0A315ZIX7_SEDFL|nr:outer membrane beta-barrel protein [Sediminitomix flava]PWJ44778.1 hypothetical protein BC781_1011149 [Sediminitomix flava]